MFIGRGQYLRSYRKLREDLMYIENNAIKYYGVATIKRLIDKLVQDGRLEITETELGTLFTVLNYSSYQTFNQFNQRDLEQQRNSNGTATEQQRNNKKKVKKVKKDNTSQTSVKFNKESVEYKLSESLYQKILLNDSKAKEPNLYKWAEDIDKLIRLDNRSVEEIEDVIDFVTEDEFWKTNILSTSKLRKQFPQVYLRAINTNKAKKTNANSWKVDAT